MGCHRRTMWKAFISEREQATRKGGEKRTWEGFYLFLFFWGGWLAKN